MKKKIFLVLTILWTGFIFFNSAQAGDESAAMSGFFAGIAKGILNAVGLGGINAETLSYVVRKIAHFTEFFIQGALLSAFVSEVTEYKRAVIYVLFCGLFTACCDELLQMFIDGRVSAVKDVFIDFGGTVCAAALFAVWIKLKKYFTKLNK